MKIVVEGEEREVPGCFRKQYGSLVCGKTDCLNRRDCLSAEKPPKEVGMADTVPGSRMDGGLPATR